MNQFIITLTTGALIGAFSALVSSEASLTSITIKEECWGCWRLKASSLMCHKKAGMTLSLLVFLATAKAFKYKRDSLQKNLRNKLEKRLSVSEPLKDSHKGFNAGDLQKRKKNYVETCNSCNNTWWFNYIRRNVIGNVILLWLISREIWIHLPKLITFSTTTST